MAQTKPPGTAAKAHYTVLRAICMAGERVEIGATVEMTPAEYAEAASAGKVGPLQAAPEKAASKAKKAEAAE